MGFRNPGDDMSPSQHDLALNVVGVFNETLLALGGDEWTRYILVIEKDGESYRDYVVARLDRPDRWEYVSDLEDRLADDLQWRLRLL